MPSRRTDAGDEAYKLSVDLETGMHQTWLPYHRMWRKYSGTSGGDSQGEGLKATTIASANGWYVASALVLTVDFALLILEPKGVHGNRKDAVAYFAFTVLVFISTISATVGIFASAHFAEDASMIPAAIYGQFAHSTFQLWNPATPFRWAHMSLLSLLLSMAPLAYLTRGVGKAALAFAAHVLVCTYVEDLEMWRLRMWRTMELKMEVEEHLALEGWVELPRRNKLWAILKKTFLMDNSTIPLLVRMAVSVFEAPSGKNNTWTAPIAPKDT